MAHEVSAFLRREEVECGGEQRDNLIETAGVVAIEVKSGRAPDILPGLGVFSQTFKPTRTLLVGGTGIPPDEFLTRPVEDWLG